MFKVKRCIRNCSKLDLSSRIVDLVSAGKTLKENGLIEVEKLWTSLHIWLRKNMAKTYPTELEK